MAQNVFTFYSQVEPQEMIGVITNVVSKLEGKTKIDGNIVTAKWKCRNITAIPHKFVFYVGENVVRVVTSDSNWSNYARIKWEYNSLTIVLRLWDEFITTMMLMYRNLDFELERGKFHITSAKLMSNGIEQTYSSVSISKPSIGGALVGGALFGGVGAIVGGSGGKTHTIGGTSSDFANTFLVKVRYSNGLNLEGKISKTSSIYHKIVTGMVESNENI